MKRPSYFLVRLLSTAAVVAAPLLVLTAYTLYSTLQHAKSEAYQEIHDRAVSGARAVEQALDITERVVMFVASRDEVQSLSKDRCNETLHGLEEVDSARGTVMVLAIDGSVVCSSSDTPLRPNSFGDAEWFAEATAKNGLVLTSPLISRTRNRAVVLMTYPIHAGAGPAIGLVLASIDLEKLESDMRGDWPEKHGVIALVSSDDKFVARSPGTRQMLGKPVSKAVVLLKGHPQREVLSSQGTDGLVRVFTATSVSRFGLRVAASLPETEVYAGAYAEIQRSGIIAAVALALAGLLGWVLSRSLARPMRSLVATAQAHAKGDAEGVRADESLPGEFGDLASEMNAMLDARSTSEEHALRSAHAERLLGRFYECLLRTNQAIARLDDPTELFQRVCEICVDTGQASLCWVGVVRGDRVTPVAFGGPAARYTSELTSSIGPLSVSGNGVISEAIRVGEIVAFNDYMNDPRTLLKRESASAFGIRSCCSVPLSQGGVVVATLNLYAGETHVYRDGLLQLLTDMSRDISAALDAFGRAAEHKRTLDELKLSEASLAAVVETSLNAIATVDSKGLIRLWNPAAEAMFGVAAAVAIGQSSFVYIPPGQDARHAELLRKFTGDRKVPGPDAHHLRVVLNRADGTSFPALGSFSRVHVGGETMMVAFLRDASQELEAERARDAAAASEASNLAKSDFMSRMSHELRTPLNVVLGFSQLLQESAKRKLDERERKHLDLIFLAGAQLRALVDDVLDFSVIESGRLQITLADFDLIELLDGVVRMNEASARQSHVRIESMYSHMRPFELRTDPIRLRQVLLNLLSNSIKYNRPGGSVVISMEAPYGLVCIEVRDTGLGMTEEQVAGLYQPFNRLGRENSDIKGTGIGMVLVRQLVELMGGSLTVKSEINRGTVVRIELPRPKIAGALIDLNAAALPIAAEVLADEEVPRGVVLYIEDNPVNIILVEEILREWNEVTLVIAEDGETGIQKTMELNPDLILLDMQLPDMTGLDVLATFNSMHAMPRLKVVGLSASAMDDEVAAAREAGVLDYWKKPVDVGELRKSVRRLLKQAQDAKESRH